MLDNSKKPACSPLLLATPTLGDSPYLEETIQSVASLGSMVRHVLVCPKQKIDALSDRFPTLEIIEDAGRDRGLYGALNCCLGKISSWEWFSYINDDDCLLPSFKAAIEKIISRQIFGDIFYGKVVYVDHCGAELGNASVWPFASSVKYPFLADISPFCQPGTVYTRAMIESCLGFDERFKLCADSDLCVKAIGRGAKFTFVNSKVATYRIRFGQLSGDMTTLRAEESEYRRRLPEISRVEKILIKNIFRVVNLKTYVKRLLRRKTFRSETLFTGEK